MACTAASTAPWMPRRPSTSQSKGRETLSYAAKVQQADKELLTTSLLLADEVM